MLPIDAELPESLRKLVSESMREDLKNHSSLDVFELELFEWYVKETDELVENMLRSERQHVHKQMALGQEPINDSGIVAAEYYLKRVRYSHVIYLASVLETFLERECGRINTAIGERNIPFKLNELNGDQWSRKRKYLERYGRFEVSPDAWQKAEDLIALRNHLVHDNGSPSELNDQQRARLSKLQGIKFNQTQAIVDKEYIQHAFQAVKDLCSEIHEKVNSAIDHTDQDRKSG